MAGKCTRRDMAMAESCRMVAAVAHRDEQRKPIIGQHDHLSCSLSAGDRKLVCVTCGNSYMGAHLVKKLLASCYLVRVTIQNQVDFEDMKELMGEEEMRQLESVVIAKMGDLEDLCEAFRGCHAIFHTSSFIDPHGISGYTERMAFLETEGARNVVEACGRAAHVKRCILTSSLLASIWNSSGSIDRVVDEGSWSDEEFCRQNKLWLALGKTAAERIAWRRSRELKVRLVTVCPALVMAPSFPHARIETALPYLKGGQVMLQLGNLATEDVGKIAEAHVRVYEAMDYGAYGRYLCFQSIIRRLEEVIQLENGLKMPGLLSGGGGINVASSTEESHRHRHHHEIVSARLSNSKLTRLVFQASKPSSCRQFHRL